MEHVLAKHAMKMMVRARAPYVAQANTRPRQEIAAQTVLLATCKLLLGRRLVVFAILVPTMQPMVGAQLALLVLQALRKVIMGRHLVMPVLEVVFRQALDRQRAILVRLVSMMRRMGEARRALLARVEGGKRVMTPPNARHA